MTIADRELTVAPAEEAAAPVSSAPNPVKVTRGTVFLAPELTVPMAMALATTLADTPATVVQVEAALVSVVLQPPPVGAVVGWDFTERGQIVPLTTENIAFPATGISTMIAGSFPAAGTDNEKRERVTCDFLNGWHHNGTGCSLS